LPVSAGDEVGEITMTANWVCPYCGEAFEFKNRKWVLAQKKHFQGDCENWPPADDADVVVKHKTFPGDYELIIKKGEISNERP
jgi:DNA-directed RNA polymerase subunit RPC12/RpoP